MKFTFSYPYFFIGLILIGVLNYSTFIGSSSTTNQGVSTNSTVNVTRGDMSKAIEVVGESQLVDEQSLSFNKVGTVNQVYVSVGDGIKKGDIIAELDNSIAQNSIEEAKINVDNAKLSLSQLYEGPNESNILQSKNSILVNTQEIIIAEKELENLKIDQLNQLFDAEKNLETAKTELLILQETQEKSTAQTLENIESSKKDLELLKKEKENSLGNTEVTKTATLEKIENDFRISLLDIEDSIEEIDLIFGVTSKNKDADNEYGTFIGAKDLASKSNAKSTLQATISLYNQLKIDIDSYEYLGDKQALEDISRSILETYDYLYEAADWGYKAADASILSVGSLDENTINSFKNTLGGIRSSTLNKISSIKTSLKSIETLTDTDLLADSNQNDFDAKELAIENAIKDYELTLKNNALTLDKKKQALETAQNDLASTQKKNDLAIETKVNSLASKRTSLQILNISLEELLEGPTTQNLAKAQNSVTQSEIKLESAYDDLEDYKLIAPFDGVVRVSEYMPGDNLSNDTNKVITIENPNLVETLLELDQIDIVSVEVGQEAIIEFDAFPGKPANGKISIIDTTPIKTSGVVSYQVKVMIDDSDFDEKVLSGMSSSVKITTLSKNDVLMVKSSAISERGGKKYVTKVVGSGTQEVEVETGITSDGMTEILSGVEEGDTLAIKSFTATPGNNTAAPAANSLFGTPTTTGRGAGGGGR